MIVSSVDSVFEYTDWIENLRLFLSVKRTEEGSRASALLLLA